MAHRRRSIASLGAVAALIVGCSATARPIPDELAPLPIGSIGSNVQIASVADAGGPADAGHSASGARADAPPAGCVDAQKRPLRVRHAGSDRYLVPRGVMEVVRSERKSTMTKQMDPTTGQQIGYSIVDVGDGSCLQALGFRNGDLVRSLIGHDLTDWEAIRQAFASIAKDGAAVVKLERGGKSMTVVYELQN